MDPQIFGEQFDSQKFLEARKLAWHALHTLKDKVHSGMSEEEMHQLIRDYFPKVGADKLWHPTKVRFAQNTINTFRSPSIPNTKIIDGEIFFLDMGPVFFEHEADVGKTFILGENKELQKLIDASETVFREVEQYWNKNFESGIKLYDFAKTTTEKMGYRLNLEMDGHRLSDFPHALIHKGGLGEWEYAPKSGAWVLEIHIIDEKLNRGAFYEDLLGVP